MLADKEKFLINMMRVVDLVVLFVAFPLAYFVDEFIRMITVFNVKAYATSPTWEGLLNFTTQYWLMFVGFPLIWFALFQANKIYIDVRVRSVRRISWDVFVSAVWASFVCGSVVFFFKIDMASRLFFMVYAATALVMVWVEKWVLMFVLNRAHQRGYYRENLLVVGTGNRAQAFIKSVKEHSHWGFNIVGLIDDDPSRFAKQVEGFRILGRIQDVSFILERLVIDRVIFILPKEDLGHLEGVLLECEKMGVTTSISLDIYNMNIAHLRQTDFNGFPLLEFKPFVAQEWQLFIKRFIDILLSLIALLLFSPIFIVVAFLIKTTSRGPIFFRQTRSGLNGRKFTLYKFRSMVANAEALKIKLADQNEMTGPVFKIRHDPRITPIGYWIRKTSIDELPQFLNVLKGDMSIVGPRPPLPSEVEHYEVWQRRRLSLKPGITCIWQVSGRNNIGFEDWMRMDLQYIDNWSLMLDMQLIFRTFLVVLTGYGAA